MSTHARSGYGTAAALAIFSVGLLATITVLLARENPSQLVWVAAGYMVAVILAELGLLALCAGLFGPAPAAWLAVAAAAVNAYSMYIVHLNLGLAASIPVLGASICFGLMLWATRGRLVARIIGALALAAIPAISLTDSDGPPGQGLSDTQTALLQAYGDIRLRDRPNIYLIGFDALIPREAAQVLLGLDTLAYDVSLRELGATILDNAFTTDAPSVEAFDALMLLDDRQNFDGVGYFAGRLASPVSTLFRANGYHVETGSSIPFYFGSIGREIDAQIYPTKNILTDSSLCKFASGSVRKFGVFGLCELATLLGESLIYDENIDVFDPNSVYFDSAWHAQVLSRIAETQSDRPRLSIYYYYYPIGHAPNDFVSYDDAQLAVYRNRFVIQSKMAAQVIGDLIRAIQEADPGSILMLFGDHGAKISRTANWPADARFIVQDNHAVLLAFAGTNETCAVPVGRDAYRGENYTTLGRAFASVIRCLAEEPSLLDQIVNFVDKHDFSEFVFDRQ